MKHIFLTSLTAVSLSGAIFLSPGAAHAVEMSDTADTPVAVMGPEDEYQHGLTVNGVSPTLRSVIVKDESILAYCIEYWVQAADPDHESAVTGWDEFTGDNKFKTDPQVRQHVAWILRNSHPTLTLAELASNTGITDLSEAEAVTATQAAIWHFTDDFVPDGHLTVESAEPDGEPVSEQASHNVQALFDYFTGEDNVGLNEDEVQASVTLVDGTASAGAIPEAIEEHVDHEDDHVLGPIALNASSEDVDLELRAMNAEVELEELSVMDASGELVDMSQPVSAEELWLHVPAEMETGGIELAAESSEYGYTGRLITPEPDNQRRFQTIVMVDSTSDQAATSLELNWNKPQLDVPSETPTPSEPPLEVPPTEDPVIEEPPPSETPVAEPTPTEMSAEPTPTEMSAEPKPAPTDEPTEPLREAPVDEVEAEAVKATGELAETGPYQVRNVLIALATLAAGAGLLLINRFVRKKA